MTTAFITAIVFVFALNFIVSYDVTVFVNAKHRDNNTATGDTSNIGRFPFHLLAITLYTKCF